MLQPFLCCALAQACHALQDATGEAGVGGKIVAAEVIMLRTQSDRTADAIRSGGVRCPVSEHNVWHDLSSTFRLFSQNFYKQKCRGFRENSVSLHQ